MRADLTTELHRVITEYHCFGLSIEKLYLENSVELRVGNRETSVLKKGVIFLEKAFIYCNFSNRKIAEQLNYF
jgi:hypothetical protein